MVSLSLRTVLRWPVWIESFLISCSSLAFYCSGSISRPLSRQHPSAIITSSCTDYTLSTTIPATSPSILDGSATQHTQLLQSQVKQITTECPHNLQPSWLSSILSSILFTATTTIAKLPLPPEVVSFRILPLWIVKRIPCGRIASIAARQNSLRLLLRAYLQSLSIPLPYDVDR